MSVLEGELSLSMAPASSLSRPQKYLEPGFEIQSHLKDGHFTNCRPRLNVKFSQRLTVDICLVSSADTLRKLTNFSELRFISQNI